MEPPEKPDQAPETAAQSAQESVMEMIQQTRAREAEFQSQGLTSGHAYAMTQLERRISQWPAAWGDDLLVLIYGEFRPSDHAVEFPQLGITIQPGEIKGSMIRTATNVLSARVTIKGKNIEGLTDAARRINTLLGAHSALHWGNPAAGWWCWMTQPFGAAAITEFEQGSLEPVLAALGQFPPTISRKVRAALHWVREPRQTIFEAYRSDSLRLYAGYWNAFECLVDVVCELHPQAKRSKNEKQRAIDEFLSKRSGKLDPAGVIECYRECVDPGFVSKASHALRIVFGGNAPKYITECFQVKPEQNRLYAIRNAINHGEIDPDELSEMGRVDGFRERLWFIVFGILGRILPIPCPVDKD